jgi:biotin carboxyl carrier protein
METSQWPAGLFRPEAARQSRSWLPSVPVRSPPVGWLVLAAAVTCLLGLGLLLATGTYTQVTVGAGTIVAASDASQLTAGLAGTVREVRVQAGQRVERGSIVAVIEAEVPGTAGASPLAMSAKELSASIAVEEQRMRDIREHARIREALLRARLLDAERQAAAVRGEVDTQEERAENARKIYEATVAAEAARLISKVQLLMQKDSMLAARAQAIAQRRALLDANEHRRSLRAELDALHEAVGRDTGAQKVRISELRIRLAQAASSRLRRVPSPGPGVVGDVLVEPGASVAADQVLVVLGSHVGPPVIEAFVPAEMVAGVHVGSRVDFRIRGSASTDRGRARVASISPPVYDDRGGLATDRATPSRSRVVLTVAGAGGDLDARVRPGLAVDISFPVASRRLYELAFE